MNEPPSHPVWERLTNLSSLLRFLLFFASGWAAVQLLAYFEAVIVIFAFAAMVAFLLNYPVQVLARFVPRGIAATIIFLSSLLLIVGLATTVGLTLLAQGQQLLNTVTGVITSLPPLIQKLEVFLQSRNLQVNLDAVEEQLRTLALSGIGFSLSVLQSLLTNLITLILIAVVAFFMLLDGERLWNFSLKLLPRHLRHHFSSTIQQNFLGFFRGQLLLVLFLTASTFVAFLVLNVPFALLLAVIAGFFDLIPGIGATLGVGLIFLIVLSQSPWLALQVLAVCIGLQQIQDNLIAPRIMQNSLNLNPVVVFFALLVGARVAGLLGVFLAVPLAGVLVSLLEIDEMKGES